MLPERYLVAGLDAVSRAYAMTTTVSGGFKAGHQGAAMLSWWFMLQEGRVEPAVQAIIQPQLDAAWMDTPPFAPLADEAVVADGLERLQPALLAVYGTSFQAGHHVIFSSLALRALRQRPALVTPTRIDGLRALATIYAAEDATTVARMAPPSAASAPHRPAAFSSEALAAFVDSLHAYSGHSQGYTGHVLTFGCAVLDLYALGYTALAAKAEVGYRDYMALCRLGPAGPQTTAARAPLPVQAHDPSSAGFWSARRPGYLGANIGHYGKYSYAFLSLAAQADDAALVGEARRLLYDILD